MKGNNVISGAYKHVDGTSFAAPIVASIAAQMIEANPELVPQDIKRLLIDTARRIPGVVRGPPGLGRRRRREGGPGRRRGPRPRARDRQRARPPPAGLIRPHPSEERTMQRAWPLLLMFATATTVRAQATTDVVPNENLVVDGVPKIPASVAEGVGRYTEFRSAASAPGTRCGARC